MHLEMCLLKNSAGALSGESMRPLFEASGAHVFVETGTYLGETTASMRSLFTTVISVELSEELHAAAQLRFRGDDGVALLLGDSADRLADALAIAAGRRSVIWLDAHWSGGNTARADENTPIARELLAIEKYGCGEDLILIDDIRYFIDLPAGFDKHEANGGYPRLSTILEFFGRLRGDYATFICGDILLAMPKVVRRTVDISNVVLATTALRVGCHDKDTTEKMERLVAAANGSEREVIMALPEFYRDSLKYGVGGHFCYWRGLVLEAERHFDLARIDFTLARDCGVAIEPRDWEY